MHGEQMGESAARVLRLDVVGRKVVGDGVTTSSSLVACPARGFSVALTTCLDCDHQRGLELSGDGDAAVLRCGVPEDSVLTDLPVPAPTWWRPADDIAPSDAARTPLRKVMSRWVIAVRPDLPARALLDLLLEAGISGVPVTDDRGQPLGLVSRTDLLPVGAPRVPSTEGDYDEAAYLDGLTAEDLMTPFTWSLPETAPITQAAAFMAYKRVHRLPVVNDRGEIVGLLSALDVLRWLGERNGYPVPS